MKTEYGNHKKGINYYSDWHKARDIANSLKGFPAARVVDYELGAAVQYYISGPYYPELEEKPTD